MPQSLQRAGGTSNAAADAEGKADVGVAVADADADAGTAAVGLADGAVASQPEATAITIPMARMPFAPRRHVIR